MWFSEYFNTISTRTFLNGIIFGTFLVYCNIYRNYCFIIKKYEYILIVAVFNSCLFRRSVVDITIYVDTFINLLSSTLQNHSSFQYVLCTNDKRLGSTSSIQSTTMCFTVSLWCNKRLGWTMQIEKIKLCADLFVSEIYGDPSESAPNELYDEGYLKYLIRVFTCFALSWTLYHYLLNWFR